MQGNRATRRFGLAEAFYSGGVDRGDGVFFASIIYTPIPFRSIPRPKVSFSLFTTVSHQSMELGSLSCLCSSA
jgi:hypothetical protein